MSSTRKMHLIAYLRAGPTASYAGGWRHPSAPLHDIWDAERYEHIARCLEVARFDAAFFADTLGLPDIYQGSFDNYIGRGGQTNLIDPMIVLPLMARVTKHLGLGTSVSTTFNQPYQIARSLGSLDLTQPLSAAEILRPVLFVPPSMPALDLLVKMQTTRTHMALVIDEYGGTEGLASIEDIVEMIVGDIEDEHDGDEGPKIEPNGDGSFFVDARAGLEDLSEALGTDLEELNDAEDVETAGGLVTALAGHVPVRGEIVVEGGFEFEVLDADPRRIKRLKVYRQAAVPGGAGNGTATAA